MQDPDKSKPVITSEALSQHLWLPVISPVSEMSLVPIMAYPGPAT